MSRSKSAPVSASFPLPLALQVGANEIGRRMAAMSTMTAAEEAALWQQLEQRHEAQTRALVAYRAGARARRPRRQSRPSPIPNHQFCPSMSTHAARDERLCPGSVKALQVIYAECAGKEEWRLITNGYLGGKIGRSARQVQRYVSELREFGYIEVHHVFNDIGAEVGREIKPRRLCHPRYAEKRRKSPKNGGTAATTDLSPINTKRIDSISEPDGCERNFSEKNPKGVLSPTARPIAPTSNNTEGRYAAQPQAGDRLSAGPRQGSLPVAPSELPQDTILGEKGIEAEGRKPARSVDLVQLDAAPNPETLRVNSESGVPAIAGTIQAAVAKRTPCRHTETTAPKGADGLEDKGLPPRPRSPNADEDDDVSSPRCEIDDDDSYPADDGSEDPYPNDDGANDPIEY